MQVPNYQLPADGREGKHHCLYVTVDSSLVGSGEDMKQGAPPPGSHDHSTQTHRFPFHSSSSSVTILQPYAVASEECLRYLQLLERHQPPTGAVDIISPLAPDTTSTWHIIMVRKPPPYLLSIYLTLTPALTAEPERVDVLSSFISSTADSHYRILIGDRIKYLSIAADIFDLDTLSSIPNLLASLPPLPPGEWTAARLLSPNGRLELHTRPIPGIRNVWHPARFDILSLRTVRKLSDRVYEIMHPSIGGTMIAKYARFSWEIGLAEHETRMYREIEGRGIGPEFLGHIHEHGRIIGFLLRKVEGWWPQRADYWATRTTLERLHKRGIRHGALKREEFVVGSEGEAVLLDFENSAFEGDRRVLEKEMESLGRMLQ